MADEFLNANTPMRGWNEALCTLPLERAPPGGWARVAAALDEQPAQVRKRPWRAWPLAVAATLAAMVLLPLAFDRTGSLTPVAQDATPVVRLPSSEHRAAPAAVATAEPARAVLTAPADTRITHRLASDTTTQRPMPRHEGTARKPRSSLLARQKAPSASLQPDENAQVLQALYSESAQLESLLQLARDERMTSAMDTVLSDEAYERVALIDAALSQEDLDAAQHAQLWRERVGALRDAAGVVSTSRWLATRGERIEDALVRVD